MKADDIKIAAVIGAGTMGHGIAQVLATAGIETRLHDVAAGMVERGLGAAFTRDVRDAWSAVYEALVEIMLDGMRQSSERTAA